MHLLLSRPCSGFATEPARTVSLKWPWIRTVLTSDAPRANDLDKALRHLRFIQKPWLPLSVLMEAERAAQAYRFDDAMLRGVLSCLDGARLAMGSR